ncbi:MAG TPA: DUF1015 domain-containing protein [Gemmatimonadota bacterium]|nr:DUF1015 domain-containing protein [Gemmatimonadota bacterium]
MPRLSPFIALRYRPEGGDPSDLIAPPYDVIDAQMAAELRRRSPHNAVHLVLPEGDGDERYEAAATRLATWLREGVVAPDDAAAVHVYRQRYAAEDGPRVRLALFGALELETLGNGVLPHERTHAEPRADRLALTLATRTQLSPVFLLARDPEAALLDALRLIVGAPPSLEATTPDGVEHTMWAIDEQGSAAVLCALAGRHPLLIADGHHRYETALEVSRRLGADAAGSVLACVVSAHDPGLVVQPTHRTLTSVDVEGADSLAAALERHFVVEPLGSLDPAVAEREAATDPAGMVVVGALPGGALRLSARVGGGEQAGAEAADLIAAVQFDRHVVRDLLRTDADTAAHQGLLEYHRDADEAVRRAGASGAAFLLPPVSLDAVWDAAAAGVRLPPKSTYFEPKIPSGLLFRPLR